MTKTESLIDQAYSAFNQRNIDVALALMSGVPARSRGNTGRNLSCASPCGTLKGRQAADVGR